MTTGIECDRCGGAIVPKCSLDDSQITCFGQIRLFDSIRAIQSSLSSSMAVKSLVCHCDDEMLPVQSTLIKFNDAPSTSASAGCCDVEEILPIVHRRTPMLFQRSSSVELFTFLPSNRQSVYRSVGSKLDQK